jgi:hypothetical protein
MEQSRKISKEEERLLDFLIGNNTSLKLPDNWKQDLLVSPMQDGGMGSLSLLFVSQSEEKRVFGEQISECHFLDEDGVDVIASLNVDQDGNLFELEIWKTDYSPLIRISDKFDLII